MKPPEEDKGTILVVDDSENHRLVISQEMQKLGYKTLVAENGVTAIKLVSTEAIDLILLDVIMPGIDGFTTLRHIRSNNTSQALPIIMLTSRDEADDVIQALRLGANDYAVKPIKLDELHTRIETHLKLKRATNEQLGNYRLIKKIGEGAMGIVYEAEHLETNLPAAIKVLPRSLTVKKQAVQRFLQEGALASKIQHPNIVELYDVGRDGETYYLAMELVLGHTLDELARNQPLVPGLTLEIARQTCMGLRALHNSGIIHRDIKPQNILFSEAGEVKITDFGIARDLSLDHRLTREGMGLGSLVYSAPEQIAGNADHRSDMYSLGCTLFQLLTGESAFPKDKPLEWMIDVKYAKPPLLTDVYPGLPKNITDFVAQLMSVKPDKRFPTYDALIETIKNLESGQVAEGQNPLKQWLSSLTRR